VGEYVAKSGHNRLSETERKRAKRLDKLARLLDGQFRIPGTDIRFGLDSLIGLVPGAGDVVTALFAAYIIIEARRLGVSGKTTLKMLGNVALDFFLGAIPVIGDVFDLVFKANERNIRLLEKDLGVRLSEM
jgi:hypothetical protein